jgi:hypothetical protein
MATLTVGSGQEYSTISSAVAASSSGDTIDVNAGTYINDFPEIHHNLTLQAVGGTATMVATIEPPNGKGIINEGGSGVNVTINGFDISGAKVPDGNGAGIRSEGGSLTLNGDTIHNNQDGLLSNPDPTGTILINYSTFADNGSGSGNTHNIYVGDIANFTIQNSTITGAVVGHEIKSRAESTTVQGNMIEDGPTGTASYGVDLPNGGTAIVQNNVIEKGPNAQNPSAISFGEEGNVHANSSLIVRNNTMLSDYTANHTYAVVNRTGTAATVTGNSLYGWDTVALGPANVSGNTILTTEPALSSLSPSSTSGTTSSTGASPSTTAQGTTGASTTAQGGSIPISATTLGSSSTSPTFVASATATGTPNGSQAGVQQGSSETNPSNLQSSAGASASPLLASLTQAPGTPLNSTGSASGLAAGSSQANGSSGGQPVGGPLHPSDSGAHALFGASGEHTAMGLISHAGQPIG